MLTQYQKDIKHECLEKGSGGLSLPMGSGKTIISLVLAMEYYEETGRPTLVIAAKTLIAEWIHEIGKFYGSTLVMGVDYVILHSDYMKPKDMRDFVQPKELKIVLTTPELLSKYYKECNIQNMFVSDEGGNEGTSYAPVTKPFFPMRNPRGPGILYHNTWASIFIDEAQKYTNITTIRARAMATVYGDHKWMLSGTMFYEPKIELILGYHIIINDKTFPRSLLEAKIYIRGDTFPGYNRTMVIREKNEMVGDDGPKLLKHIVDFEMTREEECVYLSMKDIMKNIKKQVTKFKLEKNTAEVRRFSSYLLACLTYLRQIIVCPMLPLASALLDISSFDKKSELSKIIVDQMNKLNLMEWANNEENACSIRMKKAMHIVKTTHAHEKIIIFTSFRSCLDVFRAFLEPSLTKGRPVFTIEANMSTCKRGRIVQEFSDTTNGVLLLTYDIGAEGLNLQQCNNIIIMDIWWNGGKIKQAVARCLRYGQTKDVNAYFLTSHTGIENALFEKCFKKLIVIDEISSGSKKTHVTLLTMNKIIRVIENKEENVKWNQILNERMWMKSTQDI